MTPGRRTLHFQDLDDILPDVDRLLDGHTTVGNYQAWPGPVVPHVLFGKRDGAGRTAGAFLIVLYLAFLAVQIAKS